jgi:hypothetical protein
MVTVGILHTQSIDGKIWRCGLLAPAVRRPRTACSAAQPPGPGADYGPPEARTQGRRPVRGGGWQGRGNTSLPDLDVALFWPLSLSG